jgi:hypothetical protein
MSNLIERSTAMNNRELHPKQMSARVIKVAEAYIGKREKKGNSGFVDPDFEKKMRAIGFKTGNAWCAFFGELVWKEAYVAYPNVVALFDKLFSASAVATYSNFANSKKFTVSKVPVLGAIAVWRHGNTWMGHLGVVTATDLKADRFVAVEGNTNAGGSREGEQVAAKPRRLNAPHSEEGLNLIGFIYPPDAALS